MVTYTGHIDRCWGNEHTKFNYVRQSLTLEEIDQWETLGYSQDNVRSLCGMMYDNKNPMPDWIDNVKNAFGLVSQTYTFYKMETLEIMPVHSDHFRTYCRLNSTTPDKVYRAVLMIEDWKPGHYFEMDNVGYVNWKAGDWFMWQGDTIHSAANIGIEPRYTLQITGIKETAQ